MPLLKGATNGDRADLIEALKFAISCQLSMIDCNLLPDPKEDEPEDAENRALWTDQVRRWRGLRRKLLAEERRAK